MFNFIIYLLFNVINLFIYYFSHSDMFFTQQEVKFNEQLINLSICYIYFINLSL